MSVDLSVLNSAQKVAVEELEGPCLIIAGAGSGKTRVLTYKIAYLIDSGISPYDILALTFTNKAAGEMKERVAHLIGGDIGNLWMGTFHSMFARILRFEAELLGFTRYYTIYDTDDSLSVLRNIMSDEGISTDKINPKAVQSAISSLKNRFILPEEFENSAKTYFEKIVSRIYPLYSEKLQKSNSMDFDDLLLKPLILFSKYPEVLEKYQNRFRYVLVDEYQDTNRAQYEIIKMLSAKYRNISVVGDDAQSIYKWRGAEIQNIFDFESDFPDHKIFRLEQNYRSTKKILDFAGLIISKNSRQIEKSLWTENHQGDNIKLMETHTEKDEASKITRFISSDIHDKKLGFRDFAVLYRTNSQSRALEESFRTHGIPYIIVGGIRFYERKEIKDILSHLKVVVNSFDDEALVRVLKLKENIGKTTLDKLTDYAHNKGLTLFDSLREIDNIKSISGKTRNRLVEMLNFIHKYRYLNDEMNLHELVKSIIDEIGILRVLRLENTIEADERASNINELLSAVAQFADNNEDSKLEDFLSQVSLVSDIDEVDDKKNAVTLMTIHSSKGLEYPVVFVSGLEEGLFPVTNAMNSQEEIEEERRLFYVAATRAKDKLYITYANQRYRFGSRSYQVRSRFIKEIDEDIAGKNLIDFESSRDQVRSAVRDKKRYRQDFTEGKTKTLKGPSITYEFLDEENYGGRDAADDVYSDIRKGKFVYHEKFGKGVVISLSGRGRDKKAEILFDDYGMKKIVLKYAKMRVDID